jgi:hypothetical protein
VGGNPYHIRPAAAQWLPSIDTDRDVSTGNKTMAIGADGPINAKYALKGQY